MLMPMRILVHGLMALLSLSLSTCDKPKQEDKPARPFLQSPLQISEILAQNQRGLTLGVHGRHGWIELHNSSEKRQNTKGLQIAVRGTRKEQRWSLPSVDMAPDAYLVLHTSGLGSKDLAGRLHADLRLPKQPRAIGLLDPEGRVLNEISQIPKQWPDLSYGSLPGSKPRYLSMPTPGKANDSRPQNKGPLVEQAEQTPIWPALGDRILVQAILRPEGNPIKRVQLEWQKNLEPPSFLPMTCQAKGGKFNCRAHIPSTEFKAGTMIRWQIHAYDQKGQSGRWPQGIDHADAPRWDGTLIRDPNQQNLLPVLYWQTSKPRQAQRRRGMRASLFFEGQFIDQVLVRKRGYRSSGWTKKNLKFELPEGHLLTVSKGVEVDEFNLSSTWSDKSSLRRELAWDTYRQAGVIDAFCFPVRVMQNGRFYALAHMGEHFDRRFLRRNDLDPKGAMYKMYDDCCTSRVEAVKKTRKKEKNDDLTNFLKGLHARALEPAAQEAFLFQHVNLPATLNYLAATVLMHDNDHVAKNYFLYRDSRGSKRWRMLPWDKDLTFGRNFIAKPGVLNDTIWADHDPQSHPLFGDREHPKVRGLFNCLIDALYRSPRIRQMFLRRLRSLMDERLQAPGTPPDQLHYEKRIAEISERMARALNMDATRWVRDWGQAISATKDTQRLIEEYLVPRRVHLYLTHGPNGSGLIPAAQEKKPTLQIRADSVDSIQIQNPGSDAVDLSNWRIEGPWTFTLPPGTVLAGQDKLNVVQYWQDVPADPSGLWFMAGLRAVDSAQGVALVDSNGEVMARPIKP